MLMLMLMHCHPSPKAEDLLFALAVLLLAIPQHSEGILTDPD
jgi:hypothetical protein